MDINSDKESSSEARMTRDRRLPRLTPLQGSEG
jgi:hypothetical protein